MHMTITEFLEARMAEDELAAYDVMGEREGDRTLAECAAKRAIITQVSDVAWCGYAVRDVILEHLAAVYKDHPEYRQDWAL